MAFDGTEQLTPFADLLNDVVDAANARLQAGTVFFDIAEANVGVSVPVVFPVAFSSPPIVIVGTNTNSLTKFLVSAVNATETGFTAVCVNQVDAGDTTGRWIAVGS